VPKLIIPRNTGLVFIKKSSSASVIQTFSNPTITPEVVSKDLLFFNDKLVIHVDAKKVKPVIFYAALSFSDVLESTVNKLKPGLINTYDYELAELFKDAPSLFNVKCTITF
jgi:hypothetical protein